MGSSTASHFKVIAASIVTATTILVFDLFCPLSVASGVLYVALVLIGLWSPWRYYVYLMAIIASFLVTIGHYVSPEGLHWVDPVNRALALFVIWITAILGLRIHDSEINLLAIVDTAAEGIITIGTDGLIISFNKAAEKIFAYSAEEVTGKNVSCLMPSPYSENHDKYIADYLQHGVAKIIGQSREVFGKRKDGTVFPMNLAVSEAKHGKQRTFTGILRDISERKEAEGQLRKFSRIAEQIPASIVITDTQGKIEYINPKFTQTSGYSAEEVIGKNPNILKSGEQSASEYKGLWETITTGREWRGELHNRKKNGELYWESVSISSLWDSEGNITNFLAVKEDVTERKLTEDALRESTELYTTIIQSEPECVKRLSKDGILLDMNPAGLNMVGADSLEQVQGMSIYDLIVPECRQAFEELNKRVFMGEPGTLEFELIGLKDNRRSVETHAVPLFNSERKVTAHLGLTRDITERLEKERQLAHAMKMEAFGRLTGSISHDFNNLLTVVLGNLQLIRDEVGPNNVDITELIDDAVSASQDGVELVERMSAFSRNQIQEPLDVDINKAIENFTRLTKRVLGENIDLKLSLSRKPLWTVSDSSQLETALLNLVINASDAMPEGGSITIKTSRKIIDGNSASHIKEIKPGQYVLICISDTGEGMTAETLLNACEPFFTTKQAGKGTGLGLSTVYSFAEQSGGHLMVESELGKGTCITLFLKESTPAVVGPESAEAHEKLPRGSETILVVEDKPQLRNYAVRVLKNLGYKILEAGDASEAIEILDTDKAITLLFSDIKMPGKIDGNELASLAVEKNHKLKVLLTTGLSEELSDSEHEMEQVFPLLKKPYTREQLAKQVRDILQG
jgi:PAS domain S-box-containing protein